VRKVALIRVAVCWLAICASLQAQQYVFRAYRQAEGLKNLAVNALATDRSGFLWLGTENGAYRFLGSGFQRFGPGEGIADVDVRAVVVDPNGIVWAGTGENLYRLDGKRFVAAASSPIHVAYWNYLTVEDAHRLLIVEKGRLYRLEHDDGGKVLSYRPVFSDRQVASSPDLARVSSVNVVSEAPHGLRVWIGCQKKLCSWPVAENGPGQARDGKLTEWDAKKGLKEDSWQGVMLDRAGTLWAGGRYRVAALTPGAAHFVDREIPGSNPGSLYPHAPFIEDREGRILAPCEDGLARWDGARWRIIGRANGLQLTGHVVSTAFDAAGDLWFATLGDGLYNWAGYQDWEGWNDDQRMPSAVVWTLLPASDGRVLMGTDKGPGWIDPRSGASGRLFDLPRWTYGQVDALGTNPDGSLWAGTFSAALVRIDAKTGKTVEFAKLPSFVTRSIKDSHGRVFFTTNTGLYEREAAHPQAVPHRVDALNAILSEDTRLEAGCESPNGTVWFLADKQLIRLQDGHWTIPPIDGLPKVTGQMLDLSCAANGDIWVTGEQAGTWRLTPGGDRLDAWQLQLPSELQTLTPVAILADSRGWVWIGTDAGLVVWNGHSWRHLTQESGLIWNDVNQGVLLAGSDGSLWIGTSGGVAHLMHPEHVFDSTPLTALITGIRRGDDRYPLGQDIRLPWSALPLRFEVSSPATRNRSELVFRYRMEGLQPDWIDDQDGTVVFSNLAPGAYTFTAMAHNPSQSGFSAPVKIDIRILPPWWKTVWFYALCCLGSVLLLVGVILLIVGRTRQRSRELERLVSERTRELEFSREQLRIQATHDGLTGMLNRVGVLKALAAEMDRAHREYSVVVVALVDLDHFKRLNDAYGHLAGDEALRSFAAAAGAALRSYDHAGRYGGEEFLLVLTEIPIEAVQQRLTNLHAAISNLKISIQGSFITLNCSLGATLFDPYAGSVSGESLLSIADEALYEAKAAGRNRLVFKEAVAPGTSAESELQAWGPAN
jgi:diguanylate cyclase (GGDEF)-like protein